MPSGFIRAQDPAPAFVCRGLNLCHTFGFCIKFRIAHGRHETGSEYGTGRQRDARNVHFLDRLSILTCLMAGLRKPMPETDIPHGRCECVSSVVSTVVLVVVIELLLRA